MRVIAAEEKPCWIVECDECGCSEIDSEGTTHYVTEQEARERAASTEWRELPDGEHWICYGCAEMHGW